MGSYTDVVDGIVVCNDCGAHASEARLVEHYKGCTPGESMNWELFYAKEQDMGMYIIEKGIPCIVGTNENFSKGTGYITTKDVTFWKEELVSEIGQWLMFLERGPTEGNRWRHWMSVRKQDVTYG